MLRRSLRCNAHFLAALLPTVDVRLPHALLNDSQTKTALDSIAEAQPILRLDAAPLTKAVSLLPDPSAHKEARRLFCDCVTAFRTELEVGDNRHIHAIRRLHLHQALMASGYYFRRCDIYGDELEPIRFVVNHYNFDVRRDRIITDLVHQTLLEHLPTTKESDSMLSDILLLERRLFGDHRLRPISGQQWLCLGAPLQDIKAEEELVRIMALEPIKTHGNVEFTWTDKEGRWKEATVRCLPEPAGTTPAIIAALEHPVSNASGLNWSTKKPVALTPEWRLRALKPAPPLAWGEYIRETLLQIWVYFFTFWAIFFLVDEEIITLIGLLWGKYHQNKLLAEQAAKEGTRVYQCNYRIW